MARKKDSRRGNNEGSIIKRTVTKNGKEYDYYMGSVTIGHDPKTGKPKRKYFSGKKREDVSRKITETQNKVNKRTFIDPSKITFEEYLKEWLAGMKCDWKGGVKGHITENTWNTYETMVRVHIIPELGSYKLFELTSMKILELINKKQNAVREKKKVTNQFGVKGDPQKDGGNSYHQLKTSERLAEQHKEEPNKRLSPRTVRYIYTTIHKALSDALEMQPPLIEFNAAEGIKKKLPKMTKTEMKTMSAQEIGVFLNALKNQKLNHHHYSPYFAAFYLELHTGLRRGELLGLQWQDIDFEKRELKVVRQLIRGKKGLYFKDPKTESSKRTIRLDERVMNILKEHQDSQTVVKLDGTGLVFCLENGDPVDPDNFTRHYQFILDKAGLGHFRFHDLRHSFVTLGLKNKIDYKTLMKFTGHASSKTFFDVYSHSDTEMQDEAAQVFGDLIDGCNKGIAETQ